jgi:hypothetical protein
MATDVNFGLQQYSAFSPPSIGACLLWLDAADSNTITGSPVTQWRDKSGRGSNAVTGLGSVTAGTAINSLNTLRFGLNQTLNLSNFQVFSTNNSIFYVIRGVTSNTSGGGTGYWIFSRTADNFSNFTGNQQFGSYQNPGAGRSYVLVMGVGGERNWGNLSTTAFSSTSNIVTTAGISYAAVNGTSLPLVATAVVRNTVAAATTYQISTSRNLGDVFTYDLGELIVYDGTLSLGEIQQVEGYLARKWGFTLPVGHPYRGLPPAMRLFQTVDIFAMSPHLWFDAADSSTITGSPVTQWSDKSGRGCNATTGLGSVVAGTAINSSNTLRFGLNQTLNISNLTMTNTNTSIVAIFRGVTSNANPSSGTGYFFFSRPVDNFSNFTGNQQFAVYQNPAAGISYAFVMGPSTERNWGQLSTTAFANRVNIVSIAGSNSADISGTSLVTNQSNAVVSNTVFTSTTYQISTSRSLGDVFTYDLGELIVFNDAISTGRSHQLQAYLAAKWGQTLASGNFFSRNPVLVPLFVPTALTNCALWLDSADSSTITLSGGTVTAWNDKSGNGRNATPGLGNILSADGGLFFNGLSTYYNTSYTGSPSAETVFLVGTWTGTTDRNYGLLGSTDSTNGRRYAINRSGGVAVTRWEKSTTGFAPTTGPTANVRFMTSAVFTGSAGTTGLNGGTQSASAAFSFSGTSTTYIGLGSTYFLGTINEIVIYSTALSSPARQRVEGYLAWKWGLQGSLPATHPFSKFRP